MSDIKEVDYCDVIRQLADWQRDVWGSRDPQITRNAEHMRTLASEVERLRAEVDRLRKLCEPVAESDEERKFWDEAERIDR